jgi:UDP-2,3-diacylglucosamine hydrolase
MRLFISDLHLEDPASPVFQTFARLLATESRRAEAIYLLGDLTEVWVGDDDDGPLAVALRDVLSSASRDCDLFVMHGNRDFLFGQQFAAQTGTVLLEDPHRLNDGTLLAHGDAFCIDDPAYQEVRAMFHSESWQRDVLAQSLAERRQLATNLREQSRQASANKAENIMDVADREVARVVTEMTATRLIHGHTHRPGRHQYDWGTRYVLGAWETCGWLARQAGADVEVQLECFPL